MHLSVFLPRHQEPLTCDDGATHHDLGWAPDDETPADAIPDGTPVTTCIHGYWVIDEGEEASP